MEQEIKPRLRLVQAIPYDSGGERLVCLRDNSGISQKTVVLPMRAFYLAALMDGGRTLGQIRAEYVQRFGDSLQMDQLERMVRELDEALMLEGERFETERRAALHAFLSADRRSAAFAGSAYPAAAPAIRRMLDEFFRNGPGPVASVNGAGRVAAVAAPHLDPRHGGPAYAHAWKALAEQCPAETFVILGVAHEPARGLYVVTDKSFETPLGIVPCDRDFTADLTRRAGLTCGDDVLLHRREHSIEFQALLLRHVFGSSRPARIVPVLCGSILETVGDAADPLSVEPVGRFVGALRDLLAERGESAAVIASVDLSHVGRKFGHAVDMSRDVLAGVERDDRALLAHAERADAQAFFDANRADGDRRRVCGFAALYTMLAAAPLKRGRLLQYGQAVEEPTQSVVSYAAMSFER